MAEAAVKGESPGQFTARWQGVYDWGIYHWGVFGYVVEVSKDGSFTEKSGCPTLAYDVSQWTWTTQQTFEWDTSLSSVCYYRIIAYTDPGLKSNRVLFSDPSNVVKVEF